MSKVVVIGSGFGGLSMAIRLQARGFDVTLLEKNAQVGGHAGQWVDSGYTFDLGPSLITAPKIIQSVFESAGKSIQDYLDLIPLDPFYRIYFHDRTHIDYTGDSDSMKAQMAAFNPQDAENYDRFMDDTKRIHDAVIAEGLGATPFMDWGTMGRFVPRAVKLKAIYPAYGLVKRYFKDERHRFIFSFHSLFIGGSPFRAPAIYLMIPYLEKAEGVWFTPGGMYSLVRAFASLFEQLGGTIHTDAEVREISVQDGKAVGVSTDDGHHEADAVVSNADIAHTYHQLINPAHRRKWSDAKLSRMKYAMSAFLIYMGVRRQYPELLHHTLILSERYRGLITDIFDRKVLPDDFSMYLHVPTRTDPSMAPERCESMYVLIPVANLSAGIDWTSVKDSYAERILEFLERDFGLTELRSHIDVLRVFTPEDFREQRNSHLGSAWGMEPKLTQTAYFRPHNRSEDVDSLYFVGAGTHPGAGLPGVLLSAQATERVILSDFGMSVD